METTTITRTRDISASKPSGHIPNTVCSGFFYANGTWNNGFTCPVEKFIQYYCCGTDSHRYCCVPEHLALEAKPDANELNSALVNKRQMMRKQFEEFQSYFLPIFLLSATVLFLLGIAIWFWLYKHKAFYSLTHDDLAELRTVPHASTDAALQTPKVHFNLPKEGESQSSAVHSATEL